MIRVAEFKLSADWNATSRSLLDLQIGVLDDTSPALDVGIVDRLHLLRRAWLGHEAELSEAFGHVGQSQHLGDLRIEPHDNSLRCARRNHESVPGGDLIAGDAAFDD